MEEKIKHYRVTLPSANLYKDDLQDIINIFSEVNNNNQIVLENEDAKFDDLNEL
jgi:hypothetical protein